eukprot:CAMPEP_0196699990 /NCGR_PEP_ID=MMETSP1090-20130531/48300_1 /TAXON_ID=37098 /ORGANISM="Isochrysis sp, Strain CCMP1244" /LENGTH=127 /DNA_ID=CAMNT_0042039713 /DNA_START=302 /DNA_END=685 /DNA_ORIENTATION=-
MKSLHQLELVPNSNAVVPVAELDKSVSLEPVRRSIPVPSSIIAGDGRRHAVLVVIEVEAHSPMSFAGRRAYVDGVDPMQLKVFVLDTGLLQLCNPLLFLRPNLLHIDRNFAAERRERDSPPSVVNAG